MNIILHIGWVSAIYVRFKVFTSLKIEVILWV